MTRTRPVLVVCLAAALCATAAFPAVVAHETPPPYPSFEPDDGFREATEIAPTTLNGLTPVRFNARAPGPEIGSPSGIPPLADRDRDYYAVDLAPGDRLPTTMYHFGSDGDVRYTVYDPSETEITTVDPDDGWGRTADGEPVAKGTSTVTARCAGTHYVEVWNGAPERAPYRLEVDDRFEDNDDPGNATTLTEGTTEGLMITSYERDYYRLDVRRGETVEAVIDFTTRAHTETTTQPSEIDPAEDLDGDGDDEESGPSYDHPAWENPSFHFRYNVLSPPPGAEPAEYELNRSVTPFPYDEMHRDRVTLDITESGTLYFEVAADSEWTAPNTRVTEWRANSARYTITVTRTGAPRPPAGEEEWDPSPSAARAALEHVDAETTSGEAGLVGSQLRGEVVNLRVDGRGTYSFEVGDDLRIERFSGCGSDDATVEMEADRETLRRIAESTRPTREFRAAYRRDDLRVDGVGPASTVRWTAVDVVTDVAEWLP